MNASSVLVVLPTTGDRLDTLAETLASVEEQRRSVSLTLVVVLPPAAVQARAMATAHRAVVVEDPHLGISQAINLGIGAARGEQYYAWIGDDDLFRPGALSTLTAMLDADPSAVLAHGACDYIDAEGRVLFTNRAGRLSHWLLPWGPDLVPHPGSVIRLDAMRRAGLFDPALKYAMDLDLFLKIRRQGRFVATASPASAFRWHPDSSTVANRLASSLEAEAVKARHLPRPLRPLSPLWHRPVRWASARAARSVSRRARAVARRAAVPV